MAAANKLQRSVTPQVGDTAAAVQLGVDVNGLQIALELTELGAQLRAQRHRREHPDASGEEVDKVVAGWLSDHSRAPDGDGWGRPVKWPRTA